MIDFYDDCKIESVKCENRGFYAKVGSPIYRYEAMGNVTKIDIIDEQYRPLQVKISTESGKIIRMFDFEEIIDGKGVDANER